MKRGKYKSKNLATPGMKRCSSCGEIKLESEFHLRTATKDGMNYECKPCACKRTRTTYRKHLGGKNWKHSPDPMGYERTREIRAKFPEKYKARTAVNNALRDGRITKTSCATCGVDRVEAHHADYSKPLEVVWLCNFHHRAIEGRNILTE